jgi:hypothetical protein
MHDRYDRDGKQGRSVASFPFHSTPDIRIAAIKTMAIGIWASAVLSPERSATLAANE